MTQQTLRDWVRLSWRRHTHVPGTASNLTCNRPHCLQQKLHDLARIAKRAHCGRILVSWSVCSCARYSQNSRTRSS